MPLKIGTINPVANHATPIFAKNSAVTSLWSLDNFMPHYYYSNSFEEGQALSNFIRDKHGRPADGEEGGHGLDVPGGYQPQTVARKLAVPKRA